MFKKLIVGLLFFATIPLASHDTSCIEQPNDPLVTNRNVKKANKDVFNDNDTDVNSDMATAKLTSQSLDASEFGLELTFEESVAKINLISDNIRVINQSVKENKVDFSLSTNNTISEMRVVAQLVDGIKIVKPIYAYKYLNKVYVSEISKDTAWYNAMKENYNLGNLTDDEIITNYKAFSRLSLSSQSSSVVYNSYSDISPMSSTSGKETYVQGYLKWTDIDGNTHPLVDTNIIIYDEDLFGIGVKMGETYTDLNGYFRFTFDNPDEWYRFENGGADPFIRICAEAETFSVRRDWIFNYLTIYDFISNTAGNVSTGSTTTFNITIPYDSGNMSANAFSISQGMVMGQKLAHEIGNMPIDNDMEYRLNVAYPATTNSFSYTMFSGSF